MAKILKIDREDYNNGPGIRVVVWFAGCKHKCPGCHNPDTWNPEQGMNITDEVIEYILDAVDREEIRGLTLSGGDPLAPFNLEGAMKIADAFHRRFNKNFDKDLWIWTGYKIHRLPSHVLTHPAVDVIVDGKFVQKLKDTSLKYRGSSNQKIWVSNGTKFLDLTTVLDKGN